MSVPPLGVDTPMNGSFAPEAVLPAHKYCHIILVLMFEAKNAAVRPEVVRVFAGAAAGDRCRTVRLRASRAADVLRRGEPYELRSGCFQQFEDFIWDKMADE